MSLSLQADMIKNKSLACPSIVLLEKSLNIDIQEPLVLEMYAIKNDCVILMHGDSVEAIGYDPRNSEKKFQEIMYKKTNKRLFMPRAAILVEQGGKKNSYRF